MKIERLLLGLFASFLMVGCSQNDDSPNGGEEAKGKDSYISIKVNADPISRATFEAGTAAENQVNSVHFFFFDGLGNAFNVPVPKDAEGNVLASIDENGSKANYIKATPTPSVNSSVNAGDDTNIEKILDAVVVFKVENNTYPSGVVAVLNWDYTGNALSKQQLVEHLVDTTKLSSTNFLMSNTVYMTNNYAETIDVKSISEANFGATPSDAIADGKPVELYVERLAAKVKVNVDTSASDYQAINSIPAFKVAEAPNISGDNKPIYAQLLAWDINTTANKSYLVKKFDSSSTWSTDSPFTGWNDESNKRSYYASAVDNNDDYKSTFTWDGIENSFDLSDYCFENTNTTVSKQTNVLVKARLVTEEQSGTYSPVTVCQWYAKYYVGIDALKGAVATALKDKVFEMTSATPETYSPIQAVNIDVDYLYRTSGHTSAHDAYKVTFSIPTTDSNGGAKTWYKKNGNSYVAYDTSTDEWKNICNELLPAKVWKDGATYYFTKIKHEGNLNAVIRNHYYKVDIVGVSGLGTPVYYPDPEPGEEPDPDPIPEPVVPEETETYIAAKVNVLSWKLVSNSVTLGQ